MARHRAREEDGAGRSERVRKGLEKVKGKGTHVRQANRQAGLTPALVARASSKIVVQKLKSHFLHPAVRKNVPFVDQTIELLWLDVELVVSLVI